MFFQKYFRYIVIALLALLYLGSVWQRPLYIDTEFRQAEIAREMTATAPMPGLCGELLPGEPPLVHWVNAAVMALTGEQPAAVRLAGALATLLTAGVVFLLALLVLRQADFGIRTSHGLICIAGIFTLLITGPRLANTLPAPASLLVNFISILLLMILGCHNVIMYNQSTFVLGYLLLYGYDVTGRAYLLRVLGLLVSMMVCMLVFYKNQKKRPYRRSFPDLFREFNLKSARSQWYLSLTWIVCSAMFIMQLLSLPRAMWAGIACMSVCLPFPEDSKDRTWKRGVFNILGCGIFLVLYNTLPAWLYPYIGVIGGIGVGYSAGYSWQTVFNTFGALSIAGSLFGVKTAIALRIGTNVAGALYAFLSWQILSRLLPWIFCEKDHTSLAISSK